MTTHPYTDTQTWENKLCGGKPHQFLQVDITCHVAFAPGAHNSSFKIIQVQD